MKKQYPIEPLQTELSQSAFFKRPAVKPSSQEPEASPPPQPSQKTPHAGAKPQPDPHDTMPPPSHDTVKPFSQEDMISALRKAVKPLGKEAATYRFTQAEKHALADLVYTYKRRGIRTSENEITRIGVNFLIEEYRRHGERSILAQVLERLNT
jgi:hypothetical protein